MVIITRLSCKGVPVADVTYRAGIHVEVRVGKEYRDEKINIPLAHSENGELKGSWEEALDRYFNEGRFDSSDSLFPGEMPRIGSAREHRSLFRKASQALRKDLEPRGFAVEVKYP